MTFIDRLKLFITGVGTDVKTLYARVMPSGGTTGQVLTKTSNSDYAASWQTPASGGPTINDTAASGTSVYSSNKTDSQIAAARSSLKSEILGGAGPAYDTLQELRDILSTDESTINSLITAVGTRVDVASAQSFTTAQKTQGRANLAAYGADEIGNPDTDLVAFYNSAKA